MVPGDLIKALGKRLEGSSGPRWDADSMPAYRYSCCFGRIKTLKWFGICIHGRDDLVDENRAERL